MYASLPTSHLKMRPTKINYGAKTFEVKYTEDPILADDCWGFTDFSKNEIVIYTKDLLEEVIAETLLHEAFHVAMEYAGVGGSTDEEMPAFTNEYLVSLTATATFQMLKQNPALVKYVI